MRKQAISNTVLIDGGKRTINIIRKQTEYRRNGGKTTIWREKKKKDTAREHVKTDTEREAIQQHELSERRKHAQGKNKFKQEYKSLFKSFD
jgi:hypothetical protein